MSCSYVQLRKKAVLRKRKKRRKEGKEKRYRKIIQIFIYLYIYVTKKRLKKGGERNRNACYVLTFSTLCIKHIKLSFPFFQVSYPYSV